MDENINRFIGLGGSKILYGEGYKMHPTKVIECETSLKTDWLVEKPIRRDGKALYRRLWRYGDKVANPVYNSLDHMFQHKFIAFYS